METPVLIVLFIIGIIFAFLALEVEQRIYTVICLLIATLFFGLIMLYVEAYIIGLFYILIYTGLLSVLFASVSNFIETESDSSKKTSNDFESQEV